MVKTVLENLSWPGPRPLEAQKPKSTFFCYSVMASLFLGTVETRV